MRTKLFMAAGAALLLAVAGVQVSAHHSFAAEFDAKRPVKLRLDRDDDFMVTGRRHCFWYEYDIGHDDEGRVVGRAFVLYWSSDPERSPAWVRSMSETPVKGFLSLLLGRPRLSRVGTWLAKDFGPDYEKGFAQAAP